VQDREHPRRPHERGVFHAGLEAVLLQGGRQTRGRDLAEPDGHVHVCRDPRGTVDERRLRAEDLPVDPKIGEHPFQVNERRGERRENARHDR
jgi:hypothetical protein